MVQDVQAASERSGHTFCKAFDRPQFQDIRGGEILLRKCAGKENPSDLQTKLLEANPLQTKLLRTMPLQTKLLQTKLLQTKLLQTKLRTRRRMEPKELLLSTPQAARRRSSWRYRYEIP